MKIVCSWYTLFQLAKEVGDARRGGNPEEIEEAIKRHDDYRDMCLKADEMIDLPDISI